MSFEYRPITSAAHAAAASSSAAHRPITPAAHAAAVASSSSATHRPCNRCGELGHHVRNCPKKPPRKPRAASPGFACRDSGHFACDCPQKPTPTPTPTPTPAPIPAAATRNHPGTGAGASSGNRGSATPRKPGAAQRTRGRGIGGGSSGNRTWVPTSTHAARGGGLVRGHGGRVDSGTYKATQDPIRNGLLQTPNSGYTGKGDWEPYKATQEGTQRKVLGGGSYQNVGRKYVVRGLSAPSSGGRGDICDDHNRNDGGDRGLGDAFISSGVDEEEKRVDGDICDDLNKNAVISSCADEEERRVDGGGSSGDRSWVPSSTQATRGRGSMRGHGGRGDSGTYKASQESIRRGLLQTPNSGYGGKGVSEPYKATPEGMQRKVLGGGSYQNVGWKYVVRGSSAHSSGGRGDICDGHNRNDGGDRGLGDAFISSCVDEEEKRVDGDICDDLNKKAFISSCADEKKRRVDGGSSSGDRSWVPSSTQAARGRGSMRGHGGRGDSGTYKASQDSIRRGLLQTPNSGYGGKEISEPYKATPEGMQRKVLGGGSYRNVGWKYVVRGSSAHSIGGRGDICDDHNRNDGDRGLRDASVSSCVDEEEKRVDGDICDNHNKKDGDRGVGDAFVSSCVDEEEKQVDDGSMGKGDGGEGSRGGSKSNGEEGSSARKCVILTETSSSSSSVVDYDDDDDYKDFDFWMYQTNKEAKTLVNAADVVVEKSHASVATVNEVINGGESRIGKDNSGKSCYNSNMQRMGCPFVIEISSSSSEDDDDEDDDNGNIFLNSAFSFIQWMAHRKNTSYLTPTMKVKEERRSVEDDDEDDCVILDSNPFELPTADFEQKVSLSDHNPSRVYDEDISVISERGQVACRDYPHSRHHCATFPFSKTTHESFCPQCYCYICEVVAPCVYWEGSSGHCHASDLDPLWGHMKSVMKRIRGMSN